MFDKTIVAHSISNKNDNELVLAALDEAIAQVPLVSRPDLILHSDQGSQFVSVDYVEALEGASIRRSLSYKGTCVDNSPIESFFSALKSESLSLRRGRSRRETRQIVKSYLDFYHNQRFQKGLNEMTPAEYRRHHYCLI